MEDQCLLLSGGEGSKDRKYGRDSGHNFTSSHASLLYDTTQETYNNVVQCPVPVYVCIGFINDHRQVPCLLSNIVNKTETQHSIPKTNL